MPLRDHFRSPLDDQTSWEGFHATWPTVIVTELNQILPDRFTAEPRVHLGASFEVDVASYETTEVASGISESPTGGTAMLAWAPPVPTLAVDGDVLDMDEYEVRVYDHKRGRRLVAAIEIVSPANKDRPESRSAFVSKCAALLHEQVCVVIVDVVTTRSFNLYGELLDLLGQSDPALLPDRPSLSAVCCRWKKQTDKSTLETWAYPLQLGRSLPTLPLWVTESLAFPLELDKTYEDACRILRIH